METKKVIAIGLGALVVGMCAGAVTFPVEKEIPVEVPIEVIKEVIVEVPVEKIVTETVYQDIITEVEVDNGNLDKVMDYVQDNVDEDLTVEYILFEVDAKIEAETFIRENIVSLLNDNDYFDDGEALDAYRKSEVSIKKIEDAVVEDNDFENKDLTLSYEVKVRAKEGSEDAEYFLFKVTVPFEDGKLVDEDVEIELI